MVNTVIFDADGMVIAKPKILPSKKFSQDLNVPLEEILVFFKNEFKQCKIGKADTKEVLKKYLPLWGWKKTTDEFLSYWFECQSTINGQIVESIKELRKNGIKCYLATDNEKNRVEYFENALGFKNIFDGIFSSSKIGYEKTQKQFWQTVFEKLNNTDKDNVLYWDDDKENIEIIKNFGFKVELYSDFKTYKNKLKKLKLIK